MKSSVKVQGLNSVNKNIGELIKTVAKTNPEALEEIGQRAVGVLKRNTPVKSGRLRQSMGYSTQNKVRSNSSNPEDVISPNREKDSVVFGTNVVYAESVEYLSTNGSQGFFLRSYKQILPIAQTIITRAFKKVVK